MSNEQKDKEIQQMFEMHGIIRGRVQGVGFRATALHFAQKLGLGGGVHNLNDGNVEIRAYGQKIDLEELLTLLRHHHSIDAIETTYLPYEGRVDEFKILY